MVCLVATCMFEVVCFLYSSPCVQNTDIVNCCLITMAYTCTFSWIRSGIKRGEEYKRGRVRGRGKRGGIRDIFMYDHTLAPCKIDEQTLYMSLHWMNTSWIFILKWFCLHVITWMAYAVMMKSLSSPYSSSFSTPSLYPPSHSTLSFLLHPLHIHSFQDTCTSHTSSSP